MLRQVIESFRNQHALRAERAKLEALINEDLKKAVLQAEAEQLKALKDRPWWWRLVGLDHMKSRI